MARRNIFQPPPPPPVNDPQSEPRSRFPNTGAMSGMKSTLRDLSSNAVREIDPSLIEESGPKDRLSFTDSEVRDLSESIRLHGQQVPIMIRPIAEEPGRYFIVYGRRRLQALRLLGIPAKALIRSLNDEQAIIAQGQENSLRLDPSFIEKALFAAELGSSGYEPAIIMDALAIDKPMLSRMGKVARVIPESVIQTIGPAHGVGRRRWEELADLVRDTQIDLLAISSEALAATGSNSSDERFARVADAVARTMHKPSSKPPALSVVLPDGQRIAEIHASQRGVTVKMTNTDSADFTHWMRENGADAMTRLYQIWKSEVGSD